jgi:hypothetical protein
VLCCEPCAHSTGHEHSLGSWTRSVARTVMRQTRWAASGAGRSGADLNAEHPARHQYHQPPLNILAAVAGTSHSR